MDEHVPCGAHVVEQVLDVAADEHAGERVDGSHDHVVATADSENEAAAAQAGSFAAYFGALKDAPLFGGRDPLEVQKELRDEWQR